MKKLNLRVLAFSVDNGCLPRETQENIQNAVRILGVDLYTEKHDELEKSLKPIFEAWSKRPTPAMIASMCLGCKYGMRRGFLRAAAKFKTPLCISGGGEPEHSFAEAFFAGDTSFLSHGLSLVWGQLREMAANPHYLLHPALLFRMFMEYVYNYSPRSIRRWTKRLHGCPDWLYLPLFHYIPWDEQEITTTITRELQWQKFAESKASWRSDCTVNLVKNYFYKCSLGFTKNEELISNMIRRGMLTRQQALRRAEHDNQIAPEFIEAFCKTHRIRFDRDEVHRRISRYSTSPGACSPQPAPR